MTAVCLDTWEALSEHLDVARVRPRLGSWVEVRRFDLPRNQSYVMVANTRELLYYRFSPSEADVVKLMDGSRTVGELVVDVLQDSGELDLVAIAGLVRLLREGNFLTEPYLDIDVALRRALLPPRTIRDGLTTFARTLTLEWAGAERMTVWLHRHGLRHIFHPFGVLLATFFAVTGFGLFLTATHEHHFALTTQSFGISFLVLLMLNLLLVYIHELGHASLLVHYGRRLKSAGFRIYFGAPSFFIDSSDALMLSRGQRIAQAFAGPGFEAVAAGVSSVALFVFPASAASPLLYRFCLLNYIVLVENLIPLLELDGYWILSDALQIPDLRPRSLAFARRDMWTKLARRERWSRAEIGLALYATTGVAFTIACFGFAYFFWKKTFGGVVGSLWHAGPGGVACLLLLVVFLTGPMLRAFGQSIAGCGNQIERSLSDLRFRTQTRWRIHAAQLLDRQPVFADLPSTVLNEVAGRVRREEVRAGQTVFRQGDIADAYYLVEAGTLDVVEEDSASGIARVVRRVGQGEAFGEFGLTTGAPRSASVVATSRTSLFALEKGTFERLLIDEITVPEFPVTRHQLDELHALTPFSHLGAAELILLAERGAWRNLAPGQALMHQGEIGHSLFALAAGRVTVDIDGETVSERGAGDFVGELSLLLDQPRIGTVSALTPVRAFELDRIGFDQLLGDAFHRGALRSHVPSNRTWDH
jgi:putative peptide zinc metalloprotease protein